MRFSILMRVQVCLHSCLLVPIAQVEYNYVYSTVCKATKTSDEQVSERGPSEGGNEGVYSLATEVKH